MKKLIFVVMLSLLVVTGCDFNKEENKEVENKKTELSVDSEIVKNIVETFQIKENTNSVERNFENLERYKIDVAIEESNNNIKKEVSCNRHMFFDDALMYDCDYINYNDLNDVYKKLFGEELSKEDLSYGPYFLLKYDNNKNIYRLTAPGAGGNTPDKVSEIVKAYSDNENIYIYERCFLELNAEGVYIFFPHNDKIGLAVNIEDYEEFKKQNINNLDLYKWTFKKNLDGTYTYKSVEYITEEF